jgi:hypothetical protein
MRAGHRRREGEVEDRPPRAGVDAARRDVLVWNGRVASIRARAAVGVPCADAPSQNSGRKAEAAESL